MTQVRQLASLLLATLLGTHCVFSHADWIGDFYSSAGAASNMTPPQAIASQAVIGYAGGGLSWRVPNKNFQPISITPPSISSGCGGIDLYLGSYSFPNKDQFVQALRNFGQAATGYFFQLALKTMAPEIESTLAYINDLATEVNSLTMNSCTEAKRAVNFVADKIWDATARDTTGELRRVGDADDEFHARLKVQEGGYWATLERRYEQLGKKRDDLVDADKGKKAYPEGNILRWALNNVNPVGMTKDEMDLIMSLIGPSLIIKSVTDSNGDMAPQTDAVGSTLDAKHISGLNGNPSSPELLQVLYCADTEALCIEVKKKTESFKPFNTRIQEVAGQLQTKISTRTSWTPTADQALVLKLTNVPVFKAVALSQTNAIAGAVASKLLPDLIEYAALDAANQFVTYYLGHAEKALAGAGAKNREVFQAEIVRMEKRIETIKTDMREETKLFYLKAGDPYVKLDQLEKVERYMYSNLNSMLAANARFGNKQ